MNTLGDILMFLASFVFLFGIVLCLRPIPSIGFARRRDGALVIVASLAVVILAQQISPKYKAQADAKAASAKVEKQKVEVERKRDESRGDLNRHNKAATTDGLRSTGGCRSDALGNMRCDYDATANFGSYSSSSSLSTKCRINPVTEQYECKSEMNVR